MKVWTRDDWERRDIVYASSYLEQEIQTGLAPSQIVNALAMLFVEMKRGRWGGKPPKLSDVNENGYLWAENYDYVRVHSHHPKFGKNVIEAASNDLKNAFVFFDFDAIEKVFAALEQDQALPNVPTYYAVLEFITQPRPPL